MPVLACIGMSLIIYILLFHSLRKTEEGKEDFKDGIISNEEPTEKCPNCHNPYSSNWRYCPYCGKTKENG